MTEMNGEMWLFNHLPFSTFIYYIFPPGLIVFSFCELHFILS